MRRYVNEDVIEEEMVSDEAQPCLLALLDNIERKNTQLTCLLLRCVRINSRVFGIDRPDEQLCDDRERPSGVLSQLNEEVYETSLLIDRLSFEVAQLETL